MNHTQSHIDANLLAKEVKFTMSTSSGNGGQNVNRVATKATLHFSVNDSLLFDNHQKERIIQKLSNKISNDGFLVVVSQASRSAEQNKTIALNKLHDILKAAIIPEKKRKKTGIPKALKEKRLTNKKRNSEKKEMRRKDFY